MYTLYVTTSFSVPACICTIYQSKTQFLLLPPTRGHHPFGQHQGARPLAGEKPGRTRIIDFRFFSADSEIVNNSGSQRLQKWILTTTTHKLVLVRVHVLLLTKEKQTLGQERGNHRLQKWTFTATTHNLVLAEVSILGADRKDPGPSCSKGG